MQRLPTSSSRKVLRETLVQQDLLVRLARAHVDLLGLPGRRDLKVLLDLRALLV